MRSLVLGLLLVTCTGERIFEQGRDQRVRDHHYHEPRREPHVTVEAESDAVDSHFGGIQVVEDDVPEWVKLTFADKFIVMGETEFLEVGDDVDRPAEADGDEDADNDDWKQFGHKKDDDNESEYEYFYSDEEGFEFDPSRDKLVSDPKKLGPEVKKHTQSSHRENPDSADDLDIDDNDEFSKVYEDSNLIQAVKQHREAVDRANAPPVVAVPINQPPGPTSWRGTVEKGVADAISMLAIKETLQGTDTVIGGKSHAPGSRRLQKQHTQGVGSGKLPSRMKDAQVHRWSTERQFAGAFKEGSRYSVGGGSVNLNPNDPRIKSMNDGVVSFLEEDQPTSLPLQGSSSEETAKNHREWLAKHSPQDEVKLPSLKRVMYSNGLPVADWEVSYVDDVLKQFGY